jgi:two-component system OmpR family sensor kinase
MINRERKNRQQAEEINQLQIAFQKNRRRFLGRLDHELKNPLTVIRAGLANISSELLNEYLTKEVSVIETQVLRISQLVADLRKMAYLEEKDPDLVQVNLVELLEEIIEVIRNRNDLNGRKLILIIPGAPWPLPEIEADPDLLLLAVHNLIENALKFTDPGDTIEIRAHEEGKHVVIEVADTGRGIPDNEQEKIWEELYRGTQSRGVPGSGLGLSLVKTIVEKHGGRVVLRSKLEQGSVFAVHLPVTRLGSASI